MYACLYAAGNPALLIECARCFSSRIEETSADTVLFDVRGLQALIGGPEQIARAIENRVGIPVNIAISDDPDAAIITARGIRGITIIPPGREASILSDLPLNLLPGSPETAELLDAWGIRKLGDLAALPPLGVAARLGPEGTYLQHLAQGRAGRQLRPIEDPLLFEEELELDDSVELLEPLLFLLARLLNDLCAQLKSRSLATDEIQLTLQLETAPPHRCAVRLPAPMADAKTLLKLLQLELNARPPGAPIYKLRIKLRPVRPRVQQHELFIPGSPEPAKLEITLSRLANLLGPENVGTPVLLDTHRPDSFRMARFSATTCTMAPRVCPSGVLTLRRYRPPQLAQVSLSGEVPLHITTAAVKSKVIACAGPWRSSGDWWQRDPWDHSEWDIAITNGSLYRVHKDLRTGRWFLEGNYD